MLKNLEGCSVSVLQQKVAGAVPKGLTGENLMQGSGSQVAGWGSAGLRKIGELLPPGRN